MPSSRSSVPLPPPLAERAASELRRPVKAAACASRRSDHTIPPVADMVGGPPAGYARWDDSRNSTRVQEISQDAAGGYKVGWTSGENTECAGFDVVVLAIPSVQAVELTGPVSPSLAQTIGRAEMAPRWTAMIETDSVSSDWRALAPDDPDLESIIHNSAKSGRPDLGGVSSWVVHASSDFSSRELERSADEIGAMLRDKFASALANAGIDAMVRSVSAHRWRYAFTTKPASDTLEALADPDLPLFACGDWIHETRSDYGVQGALLSGMAAAGLLLGRPGPRREPIPDDLFQQASP